MTEAHRTHSRLEAAAYVLDGLTDLASGAPWRLSPAGVDGHRYRALIATTPTAERRAYADQHPRYSLEDEVEAYGGYLVAESCSHVDRDLMVAMRNAAEHLPELLRSAAAEDPHAVARAIRAIALAVLEDHVDVTPE